MPLPRSQKYFTFYRTKIYIFVAILKRHRIENLRPEISFLQLLFLSAVCTLLAVATFQLVIGNAPLPTAPFLVIYYTAIAVNILLMLLPVWVNWKLDTGTEIHSLHHSLKMIDETRIQRDEARNNRIIYSNKWLPQVQNLKQQENDLISWLGAPENNESDLVFHVQKGYFQEHTNEQISNSHSELYNDYQDKLSAVKARLSDIIGERKDLEEAEKNKEIELDSLVVKMHKMKSSAFDDLIAIKRLLFWNDPTNGKIPIVISFGIIPIIWLFGVTAILAVAQGNPAHLSNIPLPLVQVCGH